MTEVLHVPRHDVGAVERVLDERQGEVAAFIGEPVQGAAGVHPPFPDYWDGVQALCQEADVLLIADEVVTASAESVPGSAASGTGSPPT